MAHVGQTVAAKAVAPAPPVQRAANAASALHEVRQSNLLSSLSAIPAIQRKCAACAAKDTDLTMSVQPRLKVGAVDDTYEREADSIAGKVMAMRDPEHATESDEIVQRSHVACQAESGSVGEHIAATDAQLTSGGSALSEHTRTFFESRMGRDLSNVRIHQGNGANALNASIGARAFTYKNHVWLSGAESAVPSFTMAHELAHVMQQTAPGRLGVQANNASNANARVSGSNASVQRRNNAFWLLDDKKSAIGIHKRMHDIAVDSVRKTKRTLMTEVPIPGANRKKVDYGLSGRADIYTAGGDEPGKIMVPGVKQVVAPGQDPATVDADSSPLITLLDNFDPKTYQSMKQGKRTVKHKSRRAPKISRDGKILDMDDAPENIRIGEMKPAHDMRYRKSGADQIANYFRGINSVADQINTEAQKQGLSERWTPSTAAIDATTLIPPGWDARNTHTDWNIKSIKIRHYKPTRAKNKPGRKKVRAVDSRQGRPVGDRIRGRWMMAPDNEPGHEGVFVYFLAPNPQDLATALGRPSTGRTFTGLAAKLEDIKHKLIASPKAVPGSVAVQPLRLKQQPVKQQPSLPAARVAKPRPVRKQVKDNFKVADWEKARTGKGTASSEADNSLLGQYGATDNDLRTDIAEKGAMVEWLKDKPSNIATRYASASGYEHLHSNLKLLKGVDFWTSIKAKPFGILREKFGLFFVKAYQKTVEFANQIKAKFKSFNKGQILAGRTGTIMKAAAKVASVVLPRLAKPFLSKMFDTILNCGITGFEAKFKELIQGSVIDDVITTADEIKGKVHRLSSNVESYFNGLIKKTIDPIKQEFEQYVSEAKLVLDVVKLVKEVTTGIRIGSCVAGLALAPETVGIGAVVGCGAALGDYILSKFGLSPVDHLIGTILSDCDMQNRIGKLMAGLKFVRTLPKRAGKAIIVEIKSLLKQSDTLKRLGVFKQKDFGQHASELFCNPDTLRFSEMGYEKTDCSDTGYFKQSKTGNYDIPLDFPAYEKKSTIPAKELAWKGTEIPVGSEHKLVPDLSAVQQGNGGAAGDGGTSGENVGNTSLASREGNVENVGATPPEFRALFIHGISSGFRTDSSGNFNHETAGGCYTKTVKFSLLDTYGLNLDSAHRTVSICNLTKHKDPPYPSTPNLVKFKVDNDLSLYTLDEKKRVLVHYVMQAGVIYNAWLAGRKPDKP